MSEIYKQAGVDVDAGYKAVELMKTHVQRTKIDGVLSSIGGFGGMFELGAGYKNPVLISGTDGVGTKLKLAFELDIHDTVGIDCVAMCVNDIVCGGAKPLFFLDYIACAKNEPEKIATIVKGIADGCVLAECALIGGETAEMPGFYANGEYDLAGFSVGIVDKENIKGTAKLGNVLIGIASSGLHSNGFSLIRKIFGVNRERLGVYSEELGRTIGEELLLPTKIYVKQLYDIMDKAVSIAHITGGGFFENIPRMLPDGLSAKIERSSFPVPPIFNMIQKIGQIPDMDMFKTFNMGIGMVIAADKSNADEIIRSLKDKGEKVYIIGEICEGDKGIEII